MNVGTELDSSPGVVVKILTFIMVQARGWDGSGPALHPTALPAVEEYSRPRRCRVDPFAPSVPQVWGSGGELVSGHRKGLHPKQLRLPGVNSLETEGVSIPSPALRSKDELSQPCFCLRSLWLTVSPAWHTLPRAVCLAGSFSSFGSPERAFPGH